VLAGYTFAAAPAAPANVYPASTVIARGTDAPIAPAPQTVSVSALPTAAPQPTTAKPEPPKPPPVAWAAPRRVFAPVAAPPAAAPAPAPKPVAAPAPVAPPPQAVAALPKPAPKPAAPPKAPGTDLESATAADALAKAQLEASLR
jgi:hypothetical protein